MNSQLLNWIKELFSRFLSQTPKFFKVLQVISGIAFVITGLPQLLSDAGIELPGDWQPLADNTIAVCSFIVALIAQLSTKSTLVGIQPNGDVLKKTNDDKLPFTAKQEQKSAEKHGLDEVKVVKAEPTPTPASAPTRNRTTKAPAKKSVTRKTK